MKRIVLLVAAHFLAALAPLVMLWTGVMPTDVLTLDQATFVTGAAAPNEVGLPHNWRDGSADTAQRGTYQLRFRHPATASPDIDSHAPERLYAFYLPRHRFVAELTLNGTLIGRTGRTQHPISRQHFTPALVTFPAEFLKDENLLGVQLVSDPVGLGFLAPITLGAESALAPVKNRQYLFDIVVPQVLAAAIALLGLIVAVLVFLRAAEPGWFWFALVCVALTISMSNRFVTEPGLPVSVWERVVFLAAFWAAVTWLAFALSFNRDESASAPLPAVVLRNIMLAGAAVSLICVMVPFDLFMWLGQFVLTPLTIVIGMAASALFLFAARSDLGVTPLYFSLPAAAILGAAVHDTLMVLNLVQQQLEYLLPFAAVTLVAGITALLLHRLVASTHLLAGLNAELEERLAAREAALAESFREREAVEKRHAALQERAMLTRDLHDGLGSRLLSLQHLAGREADHRALHDAASDALRELRLLAAPLRQEAPDPSGVLALFREERLRPLEREGLQVHWRIDEVPKPVLFGSGAAFALQRLLDEALANALRHGTGNQFDVQLYERAGDVVLRLMNPVGLRRDTLALGAGTGIAGMRQRASAIGAQISWPVDAENWPEFWIVELCWPHTRADAAQTQMP